ncbi:hypothetical protein DPMN_033218 [Dreissena polymorpha]|uniref:Uncharacterized protein n=1 Tax=Dreissena polymorpha TaxID=45954 RepID=A0A9D4M679_DREPO|nr:hypothetical protein DPMN_033218 [Dreissena polymorpha]
MNHDDEVTRRNTNVSSKRRLKHRNNRIEKINEQLLETPFSEAAAMKFSEDSTIFDNTQDTDKLDETYCKQVDSDTETLHGARSESTSSGQFDVFQLTTPRPDDRTKCKHCRPRNDTI